MSKNPIKKVKDKLALRTRTQKALKRNGSDYIVISNFLSLLFFGMAFIVFLPLLKRNSDLLRLLVLMYGMFIILWALGVIYDYLIKSSRLIVNTKISNYAVLSAVNTIIGLAFPLFLINLVLATLVSTLASFRYTGTAICELRTVIVRLYNSSNIYPQVASLVFWIVVLSFIVLIFGSLLERLVKTRDLK